jgi:hypothetical protein
MKRAKRQRIAAPTRPRNLVARSPLLGKGGVHERTTQAKRRQAKIDLAKTARDPETFE